MKKNAKKLLTLRKITLFSVLILSAHMVNVVRFTYAVEPTPEEMRTTSQWSERVFNPPQTVTTEGNNVVVILSETFQTRFNKGKFGTIKIGEKTYEKGINAHANAVLEVRAAQGVKTFSAVLGIDHNETTSGGRGSVRCYVKCGGKTVYESPILHGGGKGAPMSVELNGVKTFQLVISDAGDGFVCDQSAWGDAMVELTDGRKLYVSDFVVKKQTESEKYALDDYPFSFVYGGESSRTFLKSWKKETKTEKLTDRKTCETLIFTDPDGVLQATCKRMTYSDFPTVEWTLFFKNISNEKSLILEQVRALDMPVIFTNQEYVLHHNVGGNMAPECYMMRETRLNTKNRVKKIKPEGGRSSFANLPYFNVQAGNQGLIIAVGWGGQWDASFRVMENGMMNVSAGQEFCRLYLEPGEEIRTPMSVVQFWKRGTWLDGQNVWRQWMIEHNIPRPNGELQTHHINGASSYYYGCVTAVPMSEENQKWCIDRYLEERIPLDYWWMDAGWYKCNHWWETGAWEINKARFPNGLRGVTDYAREKGIKSIVWFEPERVVPNSRLSKEHSDWILGGRLVNLGNPTAWEWVMNHFNGFVQNEKIDFYRQDFNMDPLPYWRNNDAPDREGITEIRHIEGYFAYWDELLRRNPGLRIDSCASGGNRNDIETMRRAVPLMRSDWVENPTSQQSQTLGMSIWFPFYGQSTALLDDYNIRSWFTPYLHFTTDMRNRKLDYDNMREEIRHWQEILVPLYDKDFYPLTTPGITEDVWCAWQFNDQKSGKGAIQVFRRAQSPYVATKLRLYGLEPSATYLFTDLDTGETQTLTGETAMKTGLEFRLETAPQSAIWQYKKQ